MDINLIREKFQELGDTDPNKGNYKSGYLQALNDALDVVKLFAIPVVSITEGELCEICNENTAKLTTKHCHNCDTYIINGEHN